MRGIKQGREVSKEKERESDDLGKEGKGASQGGSPRKSNPGRGNSGCKGPEAESGPTRLTEQQRSQVGRAM